MYNQRRATLGMSRRFPPPWSIEESSACFIGRDHDKQALACVYYENESGRRSSAKLLTRDEAFLIAANIAKLPSTPLQILKNGATQLLSRAAPCFVCPVLGGNYALDVP
jgi:hypothetical protein